MTAGRLADLPPAATPVKATAGTGHGARPGAIGPNAITRVAEALRIGLGAGAAERIFRAAGIAHHLCEAPTTLVDEAEVVALHRALRAEVGDARAAAVAHDAGAATARYLLAHRIPKPLQAVLRRLPARWSAAVLMTAITRHAWTFAGSGRFSSARAGRRGWSVAIQGNPLARSAAQGAPAPACDFYAATFESLFRALVHHGTEVREVCCEASGGDACRFAITW